MNKVSGRDATRVLMQIVIGLKLLTKEIMFT